jgi:hypothetical protein
VVLGEFVLRRSFNLGFVLTGLSLVLLLGFSKKLLAARFQNY